ncbi:MAG: LacI family DNA-binding transcriptional regulator [Lachnospiraceae bacterium]|nr:LacI family DNA-binding transcriptional regulator [Lachnospiraceae bacterium]
MTIYEIAQKADVSIATVSRVLNGSQSVSDKTRNKVLAIMEKYDYTPNAFARGLGLNTMNTVGILCADSSDPYLAKAIYFLEENLRANQYDCFLCCTGYELEMKQKYLNLLISKKVDSIILVGSNFIYEKDEDNQYIRDAAEQVPVMLLNASYDCNNVYCILSNDQVSMYEATNTLLTAGARKVLYYYNSRSYSARKKIAGYQKAMEEAGLLDPQYMQFYAGPHEDLQAMITQLATLHESGLVFDGLVASDDNLAMAAVKYAKQYHLHIPEELSIIGYNNSFLTACSDPELSSIDNKLESLCNQLTEALLQILSGKETAKKFVFSGELIKRGTTK